jgi:hypothetical protein
MPRGKLIAGGLVTLLMLLAPGCFGGSGSTPTSLKLAFGPDDGSEGLVVFQLRCNPPGGSIPAPSAACAIIARRPSLVAPPPSNGSCGGVIGAWAVTVTGTYDGKTVRHTFGTCDNQVDEWMKIAHYVPCPLNFMDFECTHGPYAFGKAHMRGLHPTVPNVLGMTATQARRTLRLRGLEVSFATPFQPNHQVTTQSPKAGRSATVYQVVKLTIKHGCEFC